MRGFGFVLGDMFELGKEEKDLHRRVGAYAAIRGIDVIVCIGELSRNAYEGALAGYGMEGKSVYYFHRKEEFLERWRDIIEIDDTILIKASHGMAFDGIVKVLAGE